MSFDVDWLKSLIVRRTHETWERTHGPYYLSSIAIDSDKEGADYRSIIAPLKLRQWATTTEIPGAKVVADELHKARVPEPFELQAPRIFLGLHLWSVPERNRAGAELRLAA